MKFAAPLMISAALLLAAVAQAQETPGAAAANSPYAGIVARNMFALVPIPPPDTNPPAAPVDPPPKITPNGIMDIFGKLQALFKVDVKAKQGQPAHQQAHVLSEGEMEDDITVLKINKAERTILFNNHGEIKELPLVAAASTGPAPGPGGAPGGAMGNPGMGGLRPTGAGGAAAAGRQAMLNNGRQRMAPANSSMESAPSASFNPPPMSAPMNGAANQQQSGNIEDEVMKAARDMALIEQNRIATQEAVTQGLLPPPPPTMLTPEDATGPGGLPLVGPAPGPTPVPPGRGR